MNLIVFTDSRGLEFIIRQLISNSIKYAEKSPILIFQAEHYTQERDKGILLQISDNGQGVKECDLPYLFKKGFSGDSGQLRKKSTGMGLYLAKQAANDINIRLEVESEWQKGFVASLFIIGEKEHAKE